MKKMIKNFATIGIILFIIPTVFTACQNTNNGAITLESMKNTLINAGYTIVDDSDFSAIENLTDGFVFLFPSGHGDIRTPILEFQNDTAVAVYAEYIGADGHWVAISNGDFLTFAHAHGGVPHASEARFLENLINGRDIN